MLLNVNGKATLWTYPLLITSPSGFLKFRTQGNFQFWGFFENLEIKEPWVLVFGKMSEL
jgi:hypothetical protein